MPVLNARGESLSFHAAVNGLVPNSLVGDGQVTCAAWLDDDSIVAQIEDPSARLVLYERGLPAIEPLDPLGANRVVAGAGSWLAQLTRDDKTTYTRGHLGGVTDFAEEDLRLCDLDPVSGAFVGCDYSTGERLRVYNASGEHRALVPITGAVRDYTPRLRDGYLAWIDAAGPHLSIWDGVRFAEMTLDARNERVYLVVPVPTGHGLYVLELTDTRLTLREPRETHGWVLSAPGEATFGADARVVDGASLVTWATHDGEGDREWRTVVPDRLDDPLVDLNAAPPAPSVTVPTLPKFTHPVHVAPFDDSGKAPCTVKLDDLGTYDEISSGLLTHLPAGRLLFGWDSAEAPYVPANLRPSDLYLLECYRLKTETKVEAFTRWYQNLTILLIAWPGDVGLITQLYSQGGAPPNELWRVQDVLDMQPSFVSLTDLSRRIKVLAPFKFDRANGVTAHPEYRAVLDQLVQNAREAGAPALWPIAKPHPPIPDPVHPAPIPALSSETALMLFTTKDLTLIHGGKIVTHPEDATAFAYTYPDGSFASVQPDGALQMRTAQQGAHGYEKFRATSSAGVYEANPEGTRPFVFGLVEAK